MARLLRVALERARLVSLLGLIGAAGWAFVGWMTLAMGHPWVLLAMPTTALWRPETVVAVAMMWAMMMVAMMLPSAAPMIATFDGLERRKAAPAAQPWRTGVFVAGYLVIWIGFALGATALQWSLQGMDLVTPMARSASPWLTSGLLAIAGLNQFSPLKQVCLRYCRSPIGFLMMEWRPGIGGAWIMGTQTWRVLLGLLLGVDAALVRGRRNESGVDRGSDSHRRGRKIASAHNMDDQGPGRLVPGGRACCTCDEIERS